MPHSSSPFIRFVPCMVLAALCVFFTGQAAAKGLHEGFSYRSAIDKKPRYCPISLSEIRQRANEGDVGAITLLGEVALAQGMMEAANAWFHKGAQAGYASAQYLYALHSGKDGTDQATIAIEWMRKAAAQGYVPAQADFPLMDEFLNGRANPRSAELWLGRALDNGYMQALDSLRALAAKEYIQIYFTEAAKRLAHQADQGDASATWYLGLLYESGVGVPENLDAARDRYLAAARAGHMVAQYHLAMLCLDHGDIEQYIAWLTRSAEKGYGQARIALADEYANGKNVPADPQAALKWYSDAAVSGEKRAPALLAAMFIDGRLPENQNEAFLWYTMAANMGSSEGFIGLSKMYEQGIGVRANPEMADFWRRMEEELDQPFPVEARKLLLP